MRRAYLLSRQCSNDSDAGLQSGLKLPMLETTSLWLPSQWQPPRAIGGLGWQTPLICEEETKATAHLMSIPSTWTIQLDHRPGPSTWTIDMASPRCHDQHRPRPPTRRSRRSSMPPTADPSGRPAGGASPPTSGTHDRSRQRKRSTFEVMTPEVLRLWRSGDLQRVAAPSIRRSSVQRPGPHDH